MMAPTNTRHQTPAKIASAPAAPRNDRGGARSFLSAARLTAVLPHLSVASAAEIGSETQAILAELYVSRAARLSETDVLPLEVSLGRYVNVRYAKPQGARAAHFELLDMKNGGIVYGEVPMSGEMLRQAIAARLAEKYRQAPAAQPIKGEGPLAEAAELYRQEEVGARFAAKMLGEFAQTLPPGVHAVEVLFLESGQDGSAYQSARDRLKRQIENLNGRGARLSVSFKSVKFDQGRFVTDAGEEISPAPRGVPRVLMGAVRNQEILSEGARLGASFLALGEADSREGRRVMPYFASLVAAVMTPFESRYDEDSPLSRLLSRIIYRGEGIVNAEIFKNWILKINTAADALRRYRQELAVKPLSAFLSEAVYSAYTQLVAAGTAA
ncbi:MAG: hypothetical protein HYZ52_00290 [Candidatus Omnitrophica bacterium]|nr:hypothetical protein [Candidatus Omnitrophota bacterium]